LVMHTVAVIGFIGVLLLAGGAVWFLMQPFD
jgi:hypothetical protein